MIVFGKSGASPVYYMINPAGAMSGPFQIGSTPLDASAVSLSHLNLDGFTDIVVGTQSGR